MAGEVHVRVTRRTPVFVVLDTDVDARQRQEELSMTRTYQQQCFGMTTEQGIDRYRATEAPAIIWVEAAHQRFSTQCSGPLTYSIFISWGSSTITNSVTS